VPSLEPLASRIGVTRVARLTGLDRTGVEVAAALRPDGHVLQVCNGKGTSWTHAKLSALMEAAELEAAERVPLTLQRACANDLVRRYGADSALTPWSWPAQELLQAPSLWTPEVELAWVQGEELLSRKPVQVPACAVFCPPGESPSLGPLPLRWTSNGLAAHPVSAKDAMNHGLAELLERDTLSRALPEGIHEEVLRHFRRAPTGALASWAEWLEVQGLRLCVLDVSAAAVIPVSVAAVLLLDQEGGPLPVTAGYACRERFEDAALAAFFEAAQSRLTDIQGVREDVMPMSLADTERLTRMLSRPRKSSTRTGNVRPIPKERWVKALSHAGFPQVIAVTLDSPVRVVRMLVPGLQLSELL